MLRCPLINSHLLRSSNSFLSGGFSRFGGRNANASTEISSGSKVLSKDFQRKSQIVREQKIELVKKVQQHEFDFSSQEVQIAKLTAVIRNHQQAAMQNNKMRKIRRKKILHTFEKRWRILNELRRFRIESYHKVLTELNIQHIIPPEVRAKKTNLAADVEDMRIRAFAEKLRLEKKKRTIRNEFETLKRQIKEELITQEKKS